MKETALVTGGAGFIGHYLVSSLSKDKRVIVLDNYSRGEASRLDSMPDHVIVKRCDIQNLTEVKNALLKYDFSEVYHLAAINGTDNFYNIPVEIMNVGVQGCINILKLMQDRGVKKGVFASSAEVYQDCKTVPTPESVPLLVPSVENPRYSYGLSKIFTEYYAYHFGRTHEMDIAIFRPHNVYGGNMGLKHVIPEFIMQFLNALRTSTDVLIKPKGSLSAKRAFCYVDDVVEGIHLVAARNAGVNVYNIGNTVTVTMYELLEKIAQIFQVDYRIEARDNTHVGGTMLRCPDISKSRGLGYNPITDFDTGLDKTIRWYDQNYDYLSQIKSENY